MLSWDCFGYTLKYNPEIVLAYFKVPENNVSQGWVGGGAFWYLARGLKHCEGAEYASSGESEALTPEQIPVLTHLRRRWVLDHVFCCCSFLF